MTGLLIAFLLTASTAAGQTATDGWESVPATLPIEAGSGAALISIGPDTLCYAPGNFTKALYTYSITTGTWAPFPSESPVEISTGGALAFVPDPYGSGPGRLVVATAGMLGAPLFFTTSLVGGGWIVLN